MGRTRNAEWKRTVELEAVLAVQLISLSSDSTSRHLPLESKVLQTTSLLDVDADARLTSMRRTS
jgi:hypothetical protein